MVKRRETNNIIKNPLLLSRIVSKIRSNTKQNDDKCKNSKNNYLDFILQTSNKNMKRTELIEVTSKKWNRVIPRKLNPVHYKMGQLKEERKLKKQQQVTNMIAWVNHLLSLPDNNTYNSVKTNGEKDTIRKERDEAREAALKAAQERKEEFETLASFHNTPDETEMEKENRLRDHHLIERANELKMEQIQEIKKLNQHIIQVGWLFARK